MTAIAMVYLSLLGCASTMKAVTLKRATFDLDCPEDQLQIQELTTDTWGVKGCGRRATYIIEGDCWIENSCRAIMNSGETKDEKNPDLITNATAT